MNRDSCTNVYIDKNQMAGQLGVTRRTIDAWMSKGILPYRKLGRLVRFDWNEVQEHLKARSRPAVTEPVRQPGSGIAAVLRQRAAEIRRAAVL